MGDNIRGTFPTWNYGMTLGMQGGNGGYSENFEGGGYGSMGGYGFTGPRGRGGFGMRGRGGGRGRGRMALPPQEHAMPDNVASGVEKDKKLHDSLPGVLVKAEDGSLVKVVDPDVSLPLPDVKPEPTRFDKSVHGILNGRNAAMFVNVECRKRGWEPEFEQVEAEGPVHDRTYSYTLTIGPPGSDEVTVTAGIAKSKKEAKKRCCEAMVLKIDDMPPAPYNPHMMMGHGPPPPHMMHMGGRFPGPGGRFMRGGFGPRGGPGGFFRPRLPPPESEETIFRKYDKTPKAPHPSQHHPISKLCERAKKYGWPAPVWDLVNEKVIDSKRTKHGRNNTMLYTYKVTVYPGKGQVEPKVYFGSGPTKKDAKFACGGVAWADMEGDVDTDAASTATVPEEDIEEVVPKIVTEAIKTVDYDPMQLAVKAVAAAQPKTNKISRYDEKSWLETLAKDAEKEEEFKKEEAVKKARAPTQLIKRVITPEEEAKFKKELEEREKEAKEIKKEVKSEERDRKSSDRGSRGSRERDRRKSRDRERSSHKRDRHSRDRERSSHPEKARDRERSSHPEKSRDREKSSHLKDRKYREGDRKHRERDRESHDEDKKIKDVKMESGGVKLEADEIIAEAVKLIKKEDTDSIKKEDLEDGEIDSEERSRSPSRSRKRDQNKNHRSRSRSPPKGYRRERENSPFREKSSSCRDERSRSSSHRDPRDERELYARSRDGRGRGYY